ncbi:MAG TPA: endonuclease MutS2 [Candidatus Saccharimonadales bacterium]|jgi:DNA mismatch repair protein MutS2|nr:endonuclease MutS2 [Candidatus Saccharimonadales bacterium]
MAFIDSSSRVLEFDLFRDLLAAYLSSSLGKSRVSKLVPTTDRAWIDRQQQLAEEARQYMVSGGSFEFSGLFDAHSLLAKSRIAGAVLEINELRDILLLADKASEWREIALHPPDSLRIEWGAMHELATGIADFTPLLRFFHNKILPDGALDDRASPELARIRREVEKQKRLIQESLRGYLRRLAEGGAVQDELVTIRGERFVIPVKTEQRRRVSGVVHGASSSGQTVFIEPLETIEQNNDLVRLLEEEQIEIHRILLEMTSHVGEQAPALGQAVEIMAEVEMQFAKARFSRDYGCARPTLTDDCVELKDARHPMLERNLRLRDAKIIPISLEMDSAHRQLIISGPNTGGKTVGLKTLGLLALMAQSGVPVPATSAKLPVFDAVLADIGDYQSIEQNLSTFSAHTTNIDSISKTATAHSLVLLDELGSATDPEEGAALAVAIAGHFRRIGAITIISTHHTSLKVYAANTEGVLNAAVGFDESTLQPTYELRVGVPGASAGINIAQRLGLNPQIIEAARARLNTQTQDISRFLDRLHSQLNELERDRAATRQREQELEKELKRLEKEGAHEQRQKTRDFENQMNSLLKDFEYQSREAVNAVQERAAAQKVSKEAERRMAKLRREFKEQFDASVVAHKTGADAGDPNARPHEVKHVTEGDLVKLKSLGRTAVIKRKIDENTFEVEIGGMKMRIPRHDVAEVFPQSANPVAAARATKGISISLGDDLHAPTEINVIGQNVEDATRQVEKFMDRAFLAGMPRVRIIHGSGLGILRKALRHWLKSHPHVTNVIEPQQNEGGAGATVVELKT